MYKNLKEKLWAFIIQNNPDLMFNLQEGYSVTTFLEDRVSKTMPLVMSWLEEGKEGYVIEELAIMEMTKELRPSRFNYIKDVLARDFPLENKKYAEAGVLTYECINMMEACTDLFSSFEYKDEMKVDNRMRHAIIARIHDYMSI